jgi:hypothetical protein
LWSVALLSAIGAASAYAQAGTAPLVLRLPAAARSMALGDNYTSGSGPEVLFYNPARITLATGSIVSVGTFGSGAYTGTAASTLNVAGNFTAGFGVRYLAAALPTPNGVPEPGDLLNGGSHEPSFAATFALSHTLPILGVQAGASVSYVAQSDFLSMGYTTTFSAGITQNIGAFAVGLAAQDLGQHVALSSGIYNVPERLSLGVTSQSIPVGAFIDVTPMVAVSVNRVHDVRPSGGVNFAYTPVQGFVFEARVGVRWVDSTTAQKPSPVSLGLGFTLDQLSIDYALQPYTGPGPSGMVHRIAIRAR